MRYRVFQIDAWREPDGSWRYNNSIPLCYVEMTGEPTTRKILKALRDKGLLPSSKDLPVKVDDYFSYESTWMVQKRSDSMPLFDVVGFN